MSEQSVDRICPWCGEDTLVRDGVDERCTAERCLYEEQGKYAEPGGEVDVIEPPTDAEELVEDVRSLLDKD
jgi:hypothetical protein